MSISFFKSTAWQLIAQTDMLTKLILVLIFFTSVSCVAIIIFKILSFRRHKQQMALLLQRLKQVKTFNEFIVLSKDFKETLGGRFIMSNLSSLKALLDTSIKKQGGSDTSQSALTFQDIDTLELALNQSLTDIMLEEEAYLPVLGTSAAVGPLVGLFGTIWGLIQAFLDISQEHSADIATVAPGIAEALVATLGGLIIAIPAMIAFHYFSNDLRRFEYQLNQIGDKFLIMARHSFLK